MRFCFCTSTHCSPHLRVLGTLHWLGLRIILDAPYLYMSSLTFFFLCFFIVPQPAWLYSLPHSLQWRVVKLSMQDIDNVTGFSVRIRSLCFVSFSFLLRLVSLIVLSFFLVCCHNYFLLLCYLCYYYHYWCFFMFLYHWYFLFSLFS